MVVTLACVNPDNEFQFFRSWSDCCKSCKQFVVCSRVAALSFIKSCNIEFNPELLICMECRHRKLCGMYYSKLSSYGSNKNIKEVI